EARPSPEPVPRQVHPAARRGALPPPRARGWPRARPVRGVGNDAVQALESGLDATGIDIAAFNCLLMRVKTREYNLFTLEHDLCDALARFERGEGRAGRAPAYVRDWFAPASARELLRFRSLIREYEHADVLQVVLARAARSARLTTHFDLESPRAPQREHYWCHKHRRECRPVERAAPFVRRYTLDTLARLKAFARVRTRHAADVVHGDALEVELGGPFDAVLTSPPYPPDRLPRAAPLRLRAPPPRRSPRARAGRGRGRHESSCACRVFRRHRRSARALRACAASRRLRSSRRERSSRALPRDPRPRRPAPRRAPPPTRQPQNRA